MRHPPPDPRRPDPAKPNQSGLAGFVRSLPPDAPDAAQRGAGAPLSPPGMTPPRGRSEAEVDRDAETRWEGEGGPARTTLSDIRSAPPTAKTTTPDRFAGGRAVTMKKDIADTVQALNNLLQGELAAVETYNEALPVLRASSGAGQLDECQASHQRRVLALRAEILERGGEPATTPGAWGTFAKLFEKGARALGPKMALNALEAGEDHGLKEYAGILAKVDMPARSLLSADFYPEQVRTHRIVSDLKHQMNATG